MKNTVILLHLMCGPERYEPEGRGEGGLSKKSILLSGGGGKKMI